MKKLFLLLPILFLCACVQEEDERHERFCNNSPRSHRTNATYLAPRPRPISTNHCSQSHHSSPSSHSTSHSAGHHSVPRGRITHASHASSHCGHH